MCSLIPKGLENLAPGKKRGATASLFATRGYDEKLVFVREVDAVYRKDVAEDEMQQAYFGLVKLPLVLDADCSADENN